MVEARHVSQDGAGGADSEGLLRLAWSLSRIPGIPVPDLANRLAISLMKVCGPAGIVTLQIGRVSRSGEWRSEASAAVIRPRREIAPLRRIGRLPWHRSLPDYEGLSCQLRRPSPGDPEFASIESFYRSVGASLQLAAVASDAGRGGLVVTVQLGRLNAGPDRPSSSMLSLVLPWVFRIVDHALNETDGGRPREWLTQREAEILALLAEGLSVNQIAERLGRSPYTVHDHVKSLHRKLGVRRRAALVRRATTGVSPP